MVTISYDEKPGIQALAVTTPDRPPVAGEHPSHLRDYEQALGTVSLLAGLNLHSGHVTETVSNTHKSADFIAFLKKTGFQLSAQQKIRLLLDNHSAQSPGKRATTWMACPSDSRSCSRRLTAHG